MALELYNGKEKASNEDLLNYLQNFLLPAIQASGGGGGGVITGFNLENTQLLVKNAIDEVKWSIRWHNDNFLSSQSVLGLSETAFQFPDFYKNFRVSCGNLGASFSIFQEDANGKRFPIGMKKSSDETIAVMLNDAELYYCDFIKVGYSRKIIFVNNSPFEITIDFSTSNK